MTLKASYALSAAKPYKRLVRNKLERRLYSAKAYVRAGYTVNV